MRDQDRIARNPIPQFSRTTPNGFGKVLTTVPRHEHGPFKINLSTSGYGRGHNVAVRFLCGP